MKGEEYAVGPLEFVTKEPTDMETAQMMAHLLDHHERINDVSVRRAIEKVCIRLADPLYRASIAAKEG